jgi:hypothetical protein
MTWDAVFKAIVETLRTDATILALLGGAHVYRSRAFRVRQVPSLEVARDSSTTEENEGRLDIEVHIWAGSYSLAVDLERRVLALLHGERVFLIGGVAVRSMEEDRRTTEVPDPEPELIHFVSEFTYAHVR